MAGERYRLLQQTTCIGAQIFGIGLIFAEHIINLKSSQSSGEADRLTIADHT